MPEIRHISRWNRLRLIAKRIGSIVGLVVDPDHRSKALSPQQALDIAFDKWLQNKNLPWVPPSWREPRFNILRGLLSNPITPEQAQALELVASNLYELQTVIDWLKAHPNKTWQTYWREVQEKRAEERKHAEEKERVEEKKRKLDELSEGTPLRLAAAAGNLEKVSSLIQDGANVNAKDKFGFTPLYMAAANGRASVVEFLISRGAFVSGAPGIASPLHGAAKNGHTNVAETLLAHGAEIDAKGWANTTPLHEAAMGDHADMVTLLATRGADLIAESEYGTPMNVAIHWNKRESVKALNKAGVPMSITEPQTIPEHAFISFSQRDRSTAAEFAEKLEGNRIPVWIAADDLTPGTPDWEAAVRHAINRCFALLLLASPDSRESRYVRGELSIAESKGIKIVPIWISGDEWSDCVPLGMTHGQYIDLRDSRYSEGLKQVVHLLSALREAATPRHYRVMPFWKISPGRFVINEGVEQPDWDTVPIPPGFISVAFTKPRIQQTGGVAAFFNIARYSCIHAFLDDLYLNYLCNKFKPFSYGTDWLLQEARDSRRPQPCCRLILAPWSYLFRSDTQKTERDEQWLFQTPLADCGLIAGTAWEVTPCVQPVGIAVNDRRIFEALRTSNSKVYSALRNAHLIEDVPVEDPGEQFAFRFVVSLGEWDGLSAKRLIVQTDRPIPEEELEYWLRWDIRVRQGTLR